jgi:serine protease Do
VAGIDLVYNLALVQVDGVRLPAIHFAERPAQPGDWVMALGTSYRGQPTQSVGNVATIYPDPRQPLLQLTNTVYPGNSGGAALNTRGELIGLVQGELGSPEPAGRGPDSDRRPGGMSFVQPVQTLRAAYEALRRDGRVAHGFLGVSTRSASVESDAEPGVRVPIGALVERVQPDGPAMKAGIQRGDLIVGFDRDRVEYADHLARWVASTAPGSPVDLVWVRDDIQHQATVVLGASPDAAPQWAATPSDAAAPASSSPPRIADLERQIQHLNLQLKRLKSDSVSGAR